MAIGAIRVVHTHRAEIADLALCGQEPSATVQSHPSASFRRPMWTTASAKGNRGLLLFDRLGSLNLAEQLPDSAINCIRDSALRLAASAVLGVSPKDITLAIHESERNRGSGGGFSRQQALAAAADRRTEACRSRGPGYPRPASRNTEIRTLTFRFKMSGRESTIPRRR